MKKRNLAISLVLTIIAFATNTVKFFIIGIFALIAITYVVDGLLNVCYHFRYKRLANKYYKELLKNTEYIKQVKQARYKTYFMLTGKELEKEIYKYDEHLLKCYEYSKSCINFLKKDVSKYLSKEKYRKVLEIEESEVRETGRE